MRPFGKRASGRRRRSRPVSWLLAAWCLHYPDDTLYEYLPLLRRCADELGDTPSAGELALVLDHLHATRRGDAEEHYVGVFDTRPRRGLHLTWYTHGDTRLRGSALAELAGLYRRYGYRPRGGELPDYLPALLELAATASGTECARALAGFRPALSMLRSNLAACGTPYEAAISAVLIALPNRPTEPLPSSPPAELVGLEPYGATAARESSR
ncbi:nitrate reductase molybdenum cofactor assembly chaperone [Amycolatopsis cihanbeyliensis]|uniref:Respiratory nitrate reductase chaperone NarJ n=1 Tax=Amycolatopsis cihanbeyliensis TaxID=1128664 RepID=A0A542DKL8_AMYCI|nr:nitrate reductase molybdenum cofactor assembly chaperone [Amycolatopsis cihanbeyliensis]TQJ03574.1 respiratory nitrate reductase chaperone NarJ [Amycolatopsis cihanbeyliensis]